LLEYGLLLRTGSGFTGALGSVEKCFGSWVLKLIRTNWIMRRPKVGPDSAPDRDPRAGGGGAGCLMSSCDHSIMRKKNLWSKGHISISACTYPIFVFFPIQMVEVLSEKIPLAGMLIASAWWKESRHMRCLAQLLQKKLDMCFMLERTSYLGPPISDLTDMDSLFVLNSRMFHDPYLPDLRSTSGNLLLSEIQLNFSFPFLSSSLCSLSTLFLFTSLM
jgi:hypothetical protein